jgi:hypothetical protein
MNCCCSGHSEVSSWLQSSSDLRRLDLLRLDLRHSALTPYAPRTQYIIINSQIRAYDAEDIFELPTFRNQELTLDDLVEIRKQSALEGAEKPEPEPKERTMTVWIWLRGLDWLRLASRCLRTLIRTSSEQQRLDKELRGWLLAARRVWRRSRGLFYVLFIPWTFANQITQSLVLTHRAFF